MPFVPGLRAGRIAAAPRAATGRAEPRGGAERPGRDVPHAGRTARAALATTRVTTTSAASGNASLIWKSHTIFVKDRLFVVLLILFAG